MEERDATVRRHERLEGSPSAIDPSSRAAAARDPSQPPSAANGPDDESELDVEQAERFAASFRPSWEPDAPPASTISPAPFVGTAGGAARVIRHSTRGDLSAPKLRKHRGTAYAILGGCLLGVGGLLYMAIASSSVRPSAEHASRNESTETRMEAMRAPSEPAPPAANESNRAAATSAQTAAEPDAPAQEPGAIALPNPNAPAAADQAGLDPNLAPAGNAEGTGAAPNAAPAAPNAAAHPDALAAANAAPANPAPAPASPSTETANANAQAAANANSAAEVVAPHNSQNPAANAANPHPGVPDIKTPEEPPAAALADAKPAAAPTPAAAPQPSAASEKSSRVVLSLAAHPPTTRLKLDGAPVGNPFRGRLPRASKHRIEARAPGYAPEVHSVRLENDVQLMISLKRERPPNVKSDPYREQRRTSAAAQPASPARSRGAGFVAENPY